MKTNLNLTIISSLNINQKPISNITSARLKFEPNPDKKPYILFDSNQDAPIGFGVKVSATKNTYIIQTRVPNGKVVKAKVGNVRDMTLAKARDIGRSLVETAKENNQNPNKFNKSAIASDYTLIRCFEIYIEHLKTRAQPAAENTFLAIQKAVNKLDVWHNLRIKDITPNDILKKFDSIAANHRTSAEQTFRWAIGAVNFVIGHEFESALHQDREPILKYNPFTTLMFNKKYRSKSSLEQSYEKNSVRNPLDDKKLGLWITEILNRRSTTPTGCDYLLLTTLWGNRKNETFKLQWKHLLSEEEIKNASFVDLDNKVVFFRKTKNGLDHVLPLTTVTYKILLDRLENADSENKNYKWVFPAQSPRSKVGYYSDPRELKEKICESAEISLIKMHDLRRTFGRFAERNASWLMVKRLLNHSRMSDSTTKYTNKDIEEITIALEKIHTEMLKNSDAALKIFY